MLILESITYPFDHFQILYQVDLSFEQFINSLLPLHLHGVQVLKVVFVDGLVPEGALPALGRGGAGALVGGVDVLLRPVLLAGGHQVLEAEGAL